MRLLLGVISGLVLGGLFVLGLVLGHGLAGTFIYSAF
jgi:hypothetical protein